MDERVNPFETPIPKGVWLVQGTLRVVVAIQCFGMAAARLHKHVQTPMSELVANGYGLPVERIPLMEDYAAYAMIACGVVCLFRPCWMVLVPVIVWQAGIAVATLLAGQGTIPALEPAEQAVRFMAPLSLLLIDFWPPRIRPTLVLTMSAIGLLRLAAAVTFAAHGIVALYQFQNGGGFVELITRSFHNVFRYDIEPAIAQQSLALIGAMDVAVALTFLSSRHRGVAAWMVGWGLVTAFSRTLAFGVDGYHLSLIRIANGGAPLAVLVFWMLAVQEQKPKILPEPES